MTLWITSPVTPPYSLKSTLLTSLSNNKFVKKLIFLIENWGKINWSLDLSSYNDTKTNFGFFSYRTYFKESKNQLICVWTEEQLDFYTQLARHRLFIVWFALSIWKFVWRKVCITIRNFWTHLTRFSFESQGRSKNERRKQETSKFIIFIWQFFSRSKWRYQKVNWIYL